MKTYRGEYQEATHDYLSHILEQDKPFTLNNLESLKKIKHMHPDWYDQKDDTPDRIIERACREQDERLDEIFYLEHQNMGIV